MSDNKENKMEDVHKMESVKLNDSDLLIAATLIQDSVASRNFEFKQDEYSIRSYISFNHVGFKATLYICLWGNIILALFEKPTISTILLPYWITMIPEALFLAFFSVRLGHGAYFQDGMRYWRDPKNLTVLFTILLTFTDLVCYCVWINNTSDTMAAKAVRWSRPLRPLLLINFPEGRQLRKAFRNIRRTLPDIVHVLILFFSSIALFALIAYKLFHRRGLTYPNGEPYFQNYWDGIWDLYVLVTTANNPDVMMPGYDSSNWYVLLFVVYLLVNLYVFMNIVLAVIYNNYKKHLKNEVRATVHQKCCLLTKAFNILKTKTSQSDEEVVTKETWHALMATLAPTKSQVMNDLLFSVLDTSGDNCIEKDDFLKVSDLLNIELKVTESVGSCFDRCCAPCYMSKWSEKIKAGIRTRYFRWAFDALTFINAICIGLDWEMAEWFFLAAFTCEILLQLYALGPYKYFTGFWNVFDFVVIFAAMLGTIVGSALGDSRTRVLDLLMMLRILRLVRLAGSFERFKVILVTIVNIGPSICTYGGVIFVVFYVYAIIGMEIFQGRVEYHGYNTSNESLMFCGNPLLNGSEFVTKQYCSNNFNSILHAFVVLFDLLVVNQWHVLADGYVRVTHKAARMYFITFHVLCVIILLNIFTAFVLEAFILEYTLSKSHLESIVETRIKELGLSVGQNPKANFHKKSDRQELVENMEAPDGSAAADDASVNDVNVAERGNTDPSASLPDDCGLRFSLKRNRSKRLEVLLQLMFGDDTDRSDLSLGDSTSKQHSGAALQNIL